MQTTLPIESYLAELSSRDIKLWVADGKLRCNAPDGVLTPELQAGLAERKQEILDFLSRTAAPATSDSSIKPRPHDRDIPLTFGQERIWSQVKLEQSSSLYNVPMVFLLTGKLDIQALERALTGIQNRHEALRTVFPGEDLSSARQEIKPASPWLVPAANIGRDLANMPQKQANQAIRRLLHAEVRKPFDLSTGPLCRTRLFRLGPQRCFLLFVIHHIVFDGMSKTIFLEELARGYQAALAGDASPGEPLAVQFADFALWQRDRLDQATLAQQLDYWKQRLSGDVPPLVIPNERPRQAGKGRAGSVHFTLPEGLTLQIVTFSRQEKASIFIVLLAAFNLLLNRYSGQEDLVVCAPMASREHSDVEKLIGYFNNIVVIRTDLAASANFRELVGQVRRLSIEAYDNQNVPLQYVAGLPNLLRATLTRAMFSFQESSSQHLELPGVVAKPVSVRKDAADFDLAVYVERDGDTLGGVLDFNADIFSPESVKRFLQRYGKILELAVAHPERLLNDFPSFGKKPANIQNLLTNHPQIDEAIVTRTPQTGALHAYLVLNENDVPDLTAVRAYAVRSLPDYKVPVTFMPLDEMPLLADGSVDVHALPQPDKGRSRLATAYVAPRSPLEKTLAEIWKKVLWLDHEVGIHDTFRDLGGHSLLSVQLVVEMEKVLQRRVPDWALAKLDTVAELAAALEKPEDERWGQDEAAAVAGSGRLPAEIYHGLRSHTASWEGKRATADSVIVGLNTDGSGQALFWCLQRYQELAQLARYLGPEQPVYGMRSGNRVMVKTQENINLLAAHYVDEILAIQPEGPYLVGGNCQAAQIAFQVAARLKSIGKEITLLILQEKFIPFQYDGPVALLFGDRSDFNPRRHFRQPEKGWRKYYGGQLAMSEIQGEHAQFFREPNVQVLTETIKKYILQAQAGKLDSITNSADRHEYQLLPDEAYRAVFKTEPEYLMIPGQKMSVSVEVTNASPSVWENTARSGIYLANRWLDSNGKVFRQFDGATELPDELLPGASAKLVLMVTAPAEPGDWLLDIDLVDEGVAWFKDKGSTPYHVIAKVK